MTTPPPPLRRTPTPADLARRPQHVLTARPQEVTTLPGPVPFTGRYTTAVQAAVLHPRAVELAVGLARLADPATGRIPDGAPIGPRALQRLTGLSLSAIRNSRSTLQREGWIRRVPDPAGGVSRIELLIPPDPAAP